jgi:recombination protein RecT
MTFKQIQRAWNQGPMKGDSKAHKNFTEEMSKKSVLNRGCKIFINTSDDSDLLIESINRTTEAEYIDYDEELIQEEIEQKANKISLDIPAEHDSGDAPDNNKQKDEPALSGPGF